MKELNYDVEEAKRKLESEVWAFLSNLSPEVRQNYLPLIESIDSADNLFELKERIKRLANKEPLKLGGIIPKESKNLSAIEPETQKLVRAETFSSKAEKRESIPAKRERAKDIYITYPADGSKKTVEKGTLVVDLFTGEVTLPDGTVEHTSLFLDNMGFDVAKKLTLDTDKNVTLSLDSGGKYEVEGGEIELTVKQGFRIVYIETTEETELNVWVSTDIESGLKTTRPDMINTDRKRYVTSMEYDTGDNLIYMGKASIASAKSDSKWRIKKFVYDVNDNLIDIKFASDKFDKVWADRTSYDYQ